MDDIIFFIYRIRIIIIRLIKKRIGSTVEYYLFGYKIMVFIVIVGNTMEYAWQWSQSLQAWKEAWRCEWSKTTEEEKETKSYTTRHCRYLSFIIYYGKKEPCKVGLCNLRQRFPYYGNGSYNCTAQGDLDCNKHNIFLRRRRRSVHIDGIKERWNGGAMYCCSI